MTAKEEQPPVSGKAPCPCGSGKKYKRCCGPRDAEVVHVQRRHSVWKVGLAAAVSAVAAFALVTVYVQREKEPVYAPAPPPKPPKAPRQPVASGPAPAPWSYNPATNQHWDPNHNHWHNGPPPAQNRTGDAAPDVPGIPNPEPWQYDTATDRHWNPDHNHWHNGPPPADAAQQPAETDGQTPEDAGAVEAVDTLEAPEVTEAAEVTEATEATEPAP